jgi:hypothetical protein
MGLERCGHARGVAKGERAPLPRPGAGPSRRGLATMPKPARRDAGHGGHRLRASGSDARPSVRVSVLTRIPRASPTAAGGA